MCFWMAHSLVSTHRPTICSFLLRLKVALFGEFGLSEWYLNVGWSGSSFTNITVLPSLPSFGYFSVLRYSAPPCQQRWFSPLTLFN